MALTGTMIMASVVAGPAEAAGSVRLGRVQYDSPGTDTRSNASRNAEYVTIVNGTARAVQLRGWTVADAQHHVYRFGGLVLAAGKSVRLHTGSGSNTTTNVYWGSGNYIWNNGGDKVTLRRSSGATVDTCSWTHDAPGYTNC